MRVDLANEEVITARELVHYAITKHAEMTMCGLSLRTKEYVARSPFRDHVTCDKCRMRIS